MKVKFQVKKSRIHVPKSRKPSPNKLSNVSICTDRRNTFETPKHGYKSGRERKPSGSIMSIAIPKRKMRSSTDCNIKPISGFIEKVFEYFFFRYFSFPSFYVFIYDIFDSLSVLLVIVNIAH